MAVHHRRGQTRIKRRQDFLWIRKCLAKAAKGAKVENTAFAGQVAELRYDKTMDSSESVGASHKLLTAAALLPSIPSRDNHFLIAERGADLPANGELLTFRAALCSQHQPISRY
jgi:hypothetical protein